MSNDKLTKAIESFLWIAFYNGFLEEINDIYEELKNPADYSIKRPEKWSEKHEYGVDEPCGVFWS